MEIWLSCMTATSLESLQSKSNERSQTPFWLSWHRPLQPIVKTHRDGRSITQAHRPSRAVMWWFSYETTTCILRSLPPVGRWNKTQPAPFPRQITAHTQEEIRWMCVTIGRDVRVLKKTTDPLFSLISHLRPWAQCQRPKLLTFIKQHAASPSYPQSA